VTLCKQATNAVKSAFVAFKIKSFEKMKKVLAFF
jgi:hypothetical protein